MADKKRALITGITGQDGSYLAELLLDQGYEVFGVIRRLSAPNVWRIQHLLNRITLLQADLLDQLSLIKAVERSKPDDRSAFAHDPTRALAPRSHPQDELEQTVDRQIRCLRQTLEPLGLMGEMTQ